jgi:spermidine/putrescine transport system permease protein
MAGEIADSGPSRRGRPSTPYLLIGPGMVWIAIFFVVPLGSLLVTSLKTGSFSEGFETALRVRNYADALSDEWPVIRRSFVFALVATVAAAAIGYPLAYVIAFRGGRFKGLLLGLVVLPFFTSFLMRTLAWKTILSDSGTFTTTVDRLHLFGILEILRLVPEGSDRLLQTNVSVIGGLTYNFLPFMVLPIYVSLEKIDRRLVEAARDLYSNAFRAFRKVVLPLSIPGVMAGSLLTFIPAAGDFVNAELLGGPQQTMVGNRIQARFFDQVDYPAAASLSFVLMALILIGVLLYARLLGTEELTG